MQLHTYRARSLAEALRLVRQELGPDASVLHTREVGSTLRRWLGGRAIEVTASAELAAPSRLPAPPVAEEQFIPPAEMQDFRAKFREDLSLARAAESSVVEQLASQTTHRRTSNAALRQRLSAAGISDATAGRWLSRLDAELTCDPEAHADRASQRLRQIIEADLPIRGAIRLVSPGPTVAALVGPTGVGKTTTLAKLAAHFRLREHRRVALVTVDTFRIGAVEQLRTYAEIMELPVEVVASPSEMAAALDRLADNDVILVDTPGRSPHDSVKLLELRKILAAAQPHETLLTLSAAGGGESLATAARAFGRVGATSLILTKLDESIGAGAAQLGQLPDWLAAGQLPLSYTTHGQNVPDDIRPAAASRLAELLVSDS